MCRICCRPKIDKEEYIDNVVFILKAMNNNYNQNMVLRELGKMVRLILVVFFHFILDKI